MPEEYPELVARFYDAVYARVRDGVDNAFYLRKIASSPGPVLEIGVGTGRLFCAALAGGADIEGVDRSPSMLARAQSKLPEEARARVRLADAVSMRLGRRYALVVAPFRVLSHVHSVDEQLRLLDNVHDHLQPGGRFIFDLYVPSARIIADGMRELVDFDGEYAPGRHLRRTVSAHADIVSQTTHGRMAFVWDEEGGESRGEWEFDLRFFFRYEIEHLVARSRLALEAMHGDFDEGPLTEASQEFVVVCKRGEG